jgi:hypothetical protein
MKKLANCLRCLKYQEIGAKRHSQITGSLPIPICVTVNDVIGYDITSDGGGDYCDSKKDKVDAFVGRAAGQFYLETNTNPAPSGSSMEFFFPAETTTQVFGEIGVDTYPNGFVPTNVWVLSARAQVGEGTGYVDLRTMEAGDVFDIAVRIQLELDGQNKVNLHYGDVLWAPGDSNTQIPNGALPSVLASVAGGPDLDLDGFSDSWTISGSSAYMNEVVGNVFNDLDPDPINMSFSFQAFKK